jgi:aryl-alcohol dehydrogenase-like predicted oxidoreductase
MLKKQGKIRAIGVSNATPGIILEYLKWGQVDAVQEKYSLLDRALEQEIIPLCKQHSISVLGYSSLALGLLSGPIAPDRQFIGDDQRKENPRFSPENRALLTHFFSELAPLARAKDCTFAQLMISWTLFDRGVDVALCGARTSKQALQNAQAGTLQFTRQDAVLVESAVKRHLQGQFRG